MRLFVGVPVPNEIKEKLERIGMEIAGNCDNGRNPGMVLVKPQNMHLTLKFMGEINPEKVLEIEQRLKLVKAAAFQCRLKGVGVFPNEKYVRIVWVGVEGNGALEALARDVATSVNEYGENDYGRKDSGGTEGERGQERETFSAHLTIARVKRKMDLTAFLQKHNNEEFGSFIVSEFHLVQSVLKPGGPEYSVLKVFVIGTPQQQQKTHDQHG